MNTNDSGAHYPIRLAIKCWSVQLTVETECRVFAGVTVTHTYTLDQLHNCCFIHEMTCVRVFLCVCLL